MVEDLIDRLTSAVKVEEDSGRLVVGEPIDRFSDEILEFLIDVGVHNIRPEELEQFLYDVNVKSENASVVITTDETDVQALLKVLLDKHARVEVYSAHDHPNTEHGRGE